MTPESRPSSAAISSRRVVRAATSSRASCRICVRLAAQLVGLGAGLAHETHGLGPGLPQRLLGLALGGGDLLGDPLAQRPCVGLGLLLAPARPGTRSRRPWWWPRRCCGRPGGWRRRGGARPRPGPGRAPGRPRPRSPRPRPGPRPAGAARHPGCWPAGPRPAGAARRRCARPRRARRRGSGRRRPPRRPAPRRRCAWPRRSARRPRRARRRPRRGPPAGSARRRRWPRRPGPATSCRIRTASSSAAARVAAACSAAPARTASASTRASATIRCDLGLDVGEAPGGLLVGLPAAAGRVLTGLGDDLRRRPAARGRGPPAPAPGSTRRRRRPRRAGCPPPAPPGPPGRRRSPDAPVTTIEAWSAASASSWRASSPASVRCRSDSVERGLEAAGGLLERVGAAADRLLLEPGRLGVPVGDVVVQPLGLRAQLRRGLAVRVDLALGLLPEPVGLGLGGVEQAARPLGDRLVGGGVVLHARIVSDPAQPVRPRPGGSSLPAPVRRRGSG